MQITNLEIRHLQNSVFCKNKELEKDKSFDTIVWMDCAKQANFLPPSPNPHGLILLQIFNDQC